MSEVHSGVIGWLSLAATPTFAIMALTTGILDGSPGNMICAAGHASLLDGMVPMYLLMSLFHSPPWLKLISSRPPPAEIAVRSSRPRFFLIGR
jgi:hypothetical protein